MILLTHSRTYMTLSNIQGKDVEVNIFYNGGWRLYYCAVECNLTVSTATIETSTTGSGDWVKVVGQKKSWSGTLSGVVKLDSGGNMNLFSLRALQFAMTPIQIRFVRTDTNGNSYTSEGTAIIVSSSDTGNINDFNTFSIDLQGTGALVDTVAMVQHRIFDNSFDNTFN